IDLADAREVLKVVEAARRDGGVEGPGLPREPVLVEEIGPMDFEALSVVPHERPRSMQHRLGTVLRDTGGVQIPVEDELADRPIARADVQDGDRRIVMERKEVAHELEAL